MGEIIDFASRKRTPKDPETRALMEKIHTLQDTLNEIWGHLDDAYANLNFMEEECGKLEKFYDEVVLELARKIGGENIPVEFLNYSKNVVPELQSDGSYKMVIKEPEMEIIFTPEED
jgi:hypothetical protein